jgi:hypothetical protein
MAERLGIFRCFPGFPERRGQFQGFGIEEREGEERGRLFARGLGFLESLYEGMRGKAPQDAFGEFGLEEGFRV